MTHMQKNLSKAESFLDLNSFHLSQIFIEYVFVSHSARS